MAQRKSTRATSAPPPILLSGLGVQYDLRLSKKRKLRDTVMRDGRHSQSGKFWALRDVDFRVEAGESVAVIGPNGAGKSTMLQVLAGILEPTVGKVAVRGKIATLLQLGAGFDPELNARENTLLVGEFLGVPHKEMVRRLPAILDFSGLEEFADAAVRTYSSGMRARLGFSVATSVEPDVLLLDEVLSTGDAAFIVKSRDRIMELMKRARAIVFVTHDLDSAATFCTRAIELEGGRIVADGPAKKVIAAYKKKMAKRSATASRSGPVARRGN
jgi:ABC-type polysaccharide/polyol phosphate transport system ATPase subunit